MTRLETCTVYRVPTDLQCPSRRRPARCQRTTEEWVGSSGRAGLSAKELPVTSAWWKRRWARGQGTFPPEGQRGNCPGWGPGRQRGQGCRHCCLTRRDSGDLGEAVHAATDLGSDSLRALFPGRKGPSAKNSLDGRWPRDQQAAAEKVGTTRPPRGTRQHLRTRVGLG